MTKITESLAGITRIFLDTAPVLYFVEKNARYLARVQPVFDRVDIGTLTAVTSPITLAECLVHPYRLGPAQLRQDFFDLIVLGSSTTFVPLTAAHADRAAELRARYNLTLADALQMATALTVRCEAFLTNDDNPAQNASSG